jgi:hypothetical protein
MFCVRNCSGTTTGDSTFRVLYRIGYSWCHNNTFDGIEPPLPNYTLRQTCVIHGGTYDADRRTTPAFLDTVHRILGAKFRQLIPQAENAARTFEFPVGGIIGWSFFSWDGGSGTYPSLGSNRAAVGNRGLAFVGNIMRSTNNTSAVLAVHADIITTVDLPAIRNFNFIGNTLAGNRCNILYVEAGNTTSVKEAYEYFNAMNERNSKTDVYDYDGGGGAYFASGYRTGNWANRFGVDRGGNRLSAAGTGGTTYGSGAADFLGEVAAIGDVINIGTGNMFTTDTSRTGTNNFAADGDWTPQAALENAIPTGMAPWRNDLFSTLIPNDGTGAAGAVQA